MLQLAFNKLKIVIWTVYKVICEWIYRYLLLPIKAAIHHRVEDIIIYLLEKQSTSPRQTNLPLDSCNIWVSQCTVTLIYLMYMYLIHAPNVTNVYVTSCVLSSSHLYEYIYIYISVSGWVFYISINNCCNNL